MNKFFSPLKNKTFLKGAAVALVIVLLVGGYIIYQKITDRVFVDNSLIQAPIITIAPSSNGKVQEIDVAEGQHVEKGDALAVVGSETLRADTDGIIISANNLTGSMASPQIQLIQMIQPVDLRIAGTLDENKGLNQIKIGQIISFTVDAFPGKTYWGYVDEISPSAKTAQLSFSISSERPTQQFIVYAKFDSVKYPEIKNGMSAKMIVYTKTH